MTRAQQLTFPVVFGSPLHSVVLLYQEPLCLLFCFASFCFNFFVINFSHVRRLFSDSERRWTKREGEGAENHSVNLDRSLAGREAQSLS